MANEMTTRIASQLQPATSGRSVSTTTESPSASPRKAPAEENTATAASQTNGRGGRSRDAKAVTAAVREINDYVQNLQRELNFSYDEGAGRTVIKVTDSDGKVIRQIPPDEALALARRLRDVLDKDQSQGLLMKVKA